MSKTTSSKRLVWSAAPIFAAVIIAGSPPSASSASDPPANTSRISINQSAIDGKPEFSGPVSIEIVSIPEYGVNGFVTGTVCGVDFDSYAVAPLILVEGLGWWTKPTFANPTVPINPDGTFVADVATGGLDNRATIFFVALIPANIEPPLAGSASCLPSFDDIAIATDSRERYGRTIEFAGYTFGVKEAPLPVGPGPNRFTFAETDVWVDSDGLHLTLTFDDGEWRSSEVVLLDKLGYGTYSFCTRSRLDELDPNAVFGAFLWDNYCIEAGAGNPNREFDVEDSRWGDVADPTNAQFVIQPYQEPGNLDRYTIPDLSDDATLTRFFTWHPCQVRFMALRGDADPFSFDEADVIHEFVYSDQQHPNRNVPDEGCAAFRFNLWLNQPADGPLFGESIEIVIASFDFTEHGPCSSDIDGDGEVAIGDMLQLLGSWGQCSATTDLDFTGVVDLLDLLQLLAHWGPC